MTTQVDYTGFKFTREKMKFSVLKQNEDGSWSVSNITHNTTIILSDFVISLIFKLNSK